ncbi:MAG: hypothetical protein K0R94_942 [Burkholderiales bacterium]|nr:hypothetical protein [Burkholderiales bacterium]
MSSKYKETAEKSRFDIDNNEFDGIFKLVEGMQNLALQALSIYNQDVEQIIRTKSTDIKYIERTLDSILGFCFNQDMLNLFKKLCRYYYFIDKQATGEYIYMYKDMYEDDPDELSAE